MRTTARLLMGLTALLLLPAVGAVAVAGTAGAEVAVDPAGVVPPPPGSEGSTPAVAVAPAVPPGALVVDVPGLGVHAGVQAAAGVQAEAPGPARQEGPDAEAQVAPSSSRRTALEPAAVAIVAAPLALLALGAAGGLGLFSRIERGALLDNPVRARVHDAVVQQPGVTISDVRGRVRIAWGTTVHHLRRLEAHGLLVSIPQGGHRHYFVANTPAATQRTALAALRQPTAHRIAALVAVRPGIDQTALCETLGLNGPSASKHLGQFRVHGLVESQRIGRRTVHRATPGLLAALGMVGQPTSHWTRSPACEAPDLLVAAP